MEDYGNRRQEARKIVMAFTLVHDLKKEKLLGYLRDLTVSGARVNGEKKQKINSQLILSIELPKEFLGGKSGRLNIDAKVANCLRISEDPASYEIGFEFTNLQPEEIKLIEELLAYYQRRVN